MPQHIAEHGVHAPGVEHGTGSPKDAAPDHRPEPQGFTDGFRANASSSRPCLYWMSSGCLKKPQFAAPFGKVTPSRAASSRHAEIEPSRRSWLADSLKAERHVFPEILDYLTNENKLEEQVE